MKIFSFDAGVGEIIDNFGSEFVFSKIVRLNISHVSLPPNRELLYKIPCFRYHLIEFTLR